MTTRNYSFDLRISEETTTPQPGPTVPPPTSRANDPLTYTFGIRISEFEGGVQIPVPGGDAALSYTFGIRINYPPGIDPLDPDEPLPPIGTAPPLFGSPPPENYIPYEYIGQHDQPVIHIGAPIKDRVTNIQNLTLVDSFSGDINVKDTLQDFADDEDVIRIHLQRLVQGYRVTTSNDTHTVAAVTRTNTDWPIVRLRYNVDNQLQYRIGPQAAWTSDTQNAIDSVLIQGYDGVGDPAGNGIRVQMLDINGDPIDLYASNRAGS